MTEHPADTAGGIDARELDALQLTGRHDVLSVALEIDPADPSAHAPTPAYRIWLRNELHAALKDVSTRQHAIEEIVQRILARVDGDIRGRGLAIFAAPDLWKEYMLPFPLPNRVRYGRPDVLPLLWAVDEYQPYAILSVDHRRAVLLRAYLGRTAVLASETLELDTHDWAFKSSESPGFAGRHGPGGGHGTQRDVFDARVDEQIRRFWRSAADAAARALNSLHIERLIIAGPVEAATGVRDLLPDRLRVRVVATLALPSHASITDIRERTLPAALAAEHRRERELVAEILDRVAAETGGVVGLPVTVAVLHQGRVHTVVVDVRRDPVVWQCGECGAMSVVEQPACPPCNGPVDRTTLMQVLPLLVCRKGARLELVSGEAADLLRPHDGVAALLRY